MSHPGHCIPSKETQYTLLLTNISMKLSNCDVTSYSKKLMQLFGDLDILSFVRISQLDRPYYQNG
jgi:hypothetical protein